MFPPPGGKLGGCAAAGKPGCWSSDGQFAGRLLGADVGLYLRRCGEWFNRDLRRLESQRERQLVTGGYHRADRPELADQSDQQSGFRRQ
jgi:hypothetical protein